MCALSQGSGFGGPGSPPQIRLFDPAATDEADGPHSLRLRGLWAGYFRPYLVRDRGAKPRTLCAYEEALDHWERLTPNDVLSAISKESLLAFRDGLAALPGRKREKLSPRTAHKHCRTIRALLAFAGKPDGRHPDALGWLAELPRATLPKLSRSRAQHVLTLVDLAACLEAARTFCLPRELADPPRWWRAILLFVYATGYRLDTVLRLERSMIADALVLVDDSLAKCGEGDEKVLPPAVLGAIGQMREPSQLVFPWPCGRRYIWVCLDRLMAAAGIPRERRRFMKFHGLRKRHGAEICRLGGLGAARMSLNHADEATTLENYLPRHEVTRQWIERLPGLEVREQRDDPRQRLLF